MVSLWCMSKQTVCLFVLLIMLFTNSYDVTEKKSFDDCHKWFNDIERYGTDTVKKVLVGTTTPLV